MSQTNDSRKNDVRNDSAQGDDKQEECEQANSVRKNDRPQLGYFLDYDRHWLQGLELLKSQLDQLKETKKRRPNPHFNTLDMYYYAKLEQSFAKLVDKDYFLTRIANNRFYGLSKEFEIVPYTMPKSHLGLRKYKFMTCPLRVLYYAIGVYLLELSQEYVQDYKRHKHIDSWYGGDLMFDDKVLNLKSTKRFFYRPHYKLYRKRVRKEIRENTECKVVIRLDIENYFDELRIPKLLALLEERVKPSIQREMNFDETTQSQLVSFFEFVASGAIGIPQSQNNVVSSFIGHLYLVFGDSILNDKLLHDNDLVECYDIIRYVDDIHIAITFKHKDSELESERSLYRLRDNFNSLAPNIADCLYQNLGLRLNPKTKIYRLSKERDRKALERSLKKVSQGIEIPDDENDESAPTKMNKICEALKDLKACTIAPHFQQPNEADDEEPLKEVYGKRVQNMLESPDIQACLTEIFLGCGDFDFELANVDALPITLLISKCDKVAKAFERFLLSKKDLTSRDTDLILSYLQHKGFNHKAFNGKKLLEYLNRNVQLKKILAIVKSRRLEPMALGYYELTEEQTKEITPPNVLDQIRLRVLAEQKHEYSVALNQFAK